MTRTVPPDPKQLPYLLRLLDDDSPQVRDAVMDQFEAFGDSLEEYLRGVPLPSHPEQRRMVERLLCAGRRRTLAARWKTLPSVAGDNPLLEEGLGMIARFLQPDLIARSLPQALDVLATEFHTGSYDHDVLGLSEFLFQVKGLAGARASYYSPQNSNLMHVIARREGLPISLACVYILVAYRVGLLVEGCNLPGHFLALAEHEGRKLVVDCFNGGIVLLESDLARLSSSTPPTPADIAALACDARVILTRVLRNLTNAFRRLEDEQAAEDAALMERLAKAEWPAAD